MGESPVSPLVHIGFPKCASTLLQRQVFPRSPDVMTRAGWEQLAFDRFVLTDHADFDPRAVAEEFAPRPGDADRVPVISNENLVGGAAARVDWLVPTADRLARTFPRARILIIVREQRSMVLSLYRQLVKRGENVRLRTAISPTGAAGYYPNLRIERLRYHLAHSVYAERFGPEQVRVMPYELLGRDDTGFVRDILTFATGRDDPSVPSGLGHVNVGYRGLTLETRRRLNVAAAENYTGPGGPHWSFKAASRAASLVNRLPDPFESRLEASYRSFVADVVGDFFVDSNRALAESTGLDLGSLGYLV